jgi:ferredoxin/flavodoxin---NADP+ reductase
MSDFSIKTLSSELNFDQLPYWDVVIIGAGPAGLAASLTTAHRGLTTLVLEAKDVIGGAPQFFYPDKLIVDVPAFPDGVLGAELSSSLYKQAKNALVQFRLNEELISILDTEQVEHGASLKKVISNQSSYLCRKVILAMGILHTPRKLPVLDALCCSEVTYRLPKKKSFEGKTVAIIGGGDSALDSAVMVQERGGSVVIVVREKTPIGKPSTLKRVLENGAVVIGSSEVKKAKVDNELIEMELSSGEHKKCHQVIISIGFLWAKELLQSLELDLKDDGTVAVDSYFETNRKGIFAVGDMHGDIKLISVAWAEGVQAAIYAFKEITSPYWLSEKRLKDHKLALMEKKLGRIDS